ncbi:unnamed protein product [Bursaphelenchus okinawaensis]|uniref:Sphingomyelin synthase-like domain-containing protein n=1 Tax=Bursaphelenchus okinawaensis TaxID=465554 RepID=A0A811LNQ9_9BILA|nr:unnamed protein product [Bursaphelenchus okinawaensis]CAG9126292.1 unnamed protein product [Bursaphelenchus okinawaensis]
MKSHKREHSESHVPLRKTSVESRSQQIECQPSNGSAQNASLMQTMSLDPEGSTTEARPNKRWRNELIKTVIAFYCLMLAAFLNFFLLTVIHDIVPLKTTKRLPDLVFFMVNQQRWAWAVGDVLSTVNAIVGFIVVLLHKERIVVIRRVFLIGAIMYGLRAVVLSVTFLPPAFDYHEEICMPQSNRTGMYASEITARFVTYVVTLGLTSGQDKILCGDLMFSGHTVVLTIMYFTQLQYSPRGLVVLRYIATPITFLGIAALVVSGGHYTMDVLIAYWLTSHVFWSYHQMFELTHEQRAQAPLSRLWWFWLCYWFENDVNAGPMKNEWNWPLPGPQFMHNIIRLMNTKLQ